MKARLSKPMIFAFAIGILIGIPACCPYLYSMYVYKFDVKPGFQVTKKISSDTRLSGGGSIHNTKIGLPLELSYVGSKFKIDIKTNANPETFFMVNIKSRTIKPFVIRSGQLRYLFPNYYDAGELEYDNFGLKTQKGNMELFVLSDAGDVVWRESIPYEVVNCGFIYGIEAI